MSGVITAWAAIAVVAAGTTATLQQGNIAKKDAKSAAGDAISRQDAAAAKLKADQAGASTMARNRSDARRARMQRESNTVYGGKLGDPETTASKKLLGN